MDLSCLLCLDWRALLGGWFQIKYKCRTCCMDVKWCRDTAGLIHKLFLGYFAKEMSSECPLCGYAQSFCVSLTIFVFLLFFV